MQKFYTVLKVKDNELNTIQKKIFEKDSEINTATKRVNELENETKSLIHQVNSSTENNTTELYGLIDKAKAAWINAEAIKTKLISERKDILSELLLKKQEIKSIEMLIAKKKKELIAENLKKEQNLLDELNSVE